MFDSATLFFFIGMSLLLALSPGPDILFVLTQSASKGAVVGIVVTLGLCTGLIVHTLAVLLGLAMLIQTSALAFMLLKCLGAAYLLYLAYGAFRAGAVTQGTTRTGEQGSLWRSYLRGIVMNVSNPKVSIFFLAFLPQFSDPARGQVSLQLVILGTLFMASTLLAFVAVSLLAGLLAEPFRRSPQVQKGLNISAGLIFTALALKLLFSQISQS